MGTMSDMALPPLPAEAETGAPVEEVEEQDSKKEEEPSFLRMVTSMTIYALVAIFFVGVAAASLGSALGYYRMDTALPPTMSPAVKINGLHSARSS